jgi:hypothetical protein
MRAASRDQLSAPPGYGPLLLASFLLGYAIVPSNGAYSETSIFVLLVALLLLVWRFAAALRPEEHLISPALVLVPAWIGALAMVWLGHGSAILLYPRAEWALGRTMQLAAGALLLTYLPSLGGRWLEPPWVRHLRFVLFTALIAAAGFDTIRTSPEPRIDVWELQHRAVDVLLAGENPYSVLTVRDTGPGNQPVPFVYPPTAIYFDLIGKKLGGDVRFAHLAAMLVTGWSLRHVVRRAGLSLPAFSEDAPALFVWLSPKLFFVLEQAWIDPLQLMLISGALALLVSGKRSLCAAVLGIAVSSKQSMFWLFPLAGIVLHFRPRQWLVMAVAAIVPVAPFAIWNFKALKYANLDFLAGLPPRDDALSFGVWFKHRFHSELPGSIVGFLAAAVVASLALWRLRGVAGFASALVLTYFVFFFFNKWAFANYYYLLLGLSALAAAASWHGPLRALPPLASEPGEGPA